MERTVRHLVMAGRPRFGDAGHVRVRIDMTGSGAILQLGYRIRLGRGSSRWSVYGLRMRARLECRCVTPGAIGAVSGERPGGLIQSRGVAGDAAGRAPVVTRVLRRGVHETQRCPVRIAMAVRAAACRRRVACNLACGGQVVMAALAVRDEPRVVEARRTPRQGGMAIAAFDCRREMLQRLGGCPDPVVTTPALTLLQQVRVLHARWNESHARMAGRAGIVGRDVCCGFTDGTDVVVAANARASGCRMIHAVYGCEVVDRMTQLAAIRGENVRRWFGCGADAAPDRVAAFAVARCPFEDALYVTVFAREIAVGAAELVPRRQVVEAGPLHGPDRGARI